MSTIGTVHLVDDDPEFLAATRRFVRSAGFPVATFSSVADLLARVSAETRGCVIADLIMPEVGGLELQQLLTRQGVLMPVVFLTGHGNIPSSVQAMRGGAIDFIEKLAPKEELTAAITRALERDAEVHLARAKLAERRRRFAMLTEREREVLGLVVRGQRNKQIAGTLGVTERTVKHYRGVISTKLGVHSVAQLAILASEASLETDTRGLPGR
jgi:two-component system, LuxR family, response regulator FixJ